MRRVALALAVPVAAAGCVSSNAPAPTVGASALVPVAFESITGAPQPVFDRLVADIAKESVARRVLIVSRTDKAEYRVRGYLSSHSEGADGRVAWVLDVFDTSRRRTVRLSGEEPAAAGESWAGASEALVAKIAAQSVAELSQWLAQAPSQPAASTEVATAPSGDSTATSPAEAEQAAAAGADDPADAAQTGTGHAVASYAPY
ncbi:hypothetical protein [Blastochloris viridis]|uniref:Lipoprotein n=1 Tax=Blastochloris viridis TaxID=1079 RepID=A0A182D332_BLAVI|nr:hypothetical protein [Blastochloris viridis]BAR99825.1 hypothetical protein BV133_2232 [Blastochloris viridis]